MPTIKQRKAAELLVENRGNIGKSMIEAGYDPTTAKNPKNLTESIGFQEVYKEIGLTPMFLTKALKDDIEQKPKNRYSEMNLAAEILGMKKQPAGDNANPQVIVNILARYESLGGTEKQAALSPG